jgi:hypothetical protein
LDEATPFLRDRALKLAPSTVGPVLEEKFSEDELKQVIAWFESPVKKKYESFGPDLQSALVQKLLAEGGPVLDPKLTALQQKIGNTLRSAGAELSKGQPAKAPASKPPAKAASK